MALLVAVAVVIDLRDQRTEARAFAAEDLTRGETVQPESISWKEVPVGLFDRIDPEGAVVVRSVRRGEPFTGSSLTAHAGPADGWWSLELELPAGAAPGQPARIVVDDPALATEALVVSVSDGGAFSSMASGLVAVPGIHADAIARAASRSRVVVLLAP